MSNLVKWIDEAIKIIKPYEFPDEEYYRNAGSEEELNYYGLTMAEFEKFQELATKIKVAAVQAKLADHLPSPPAEGNSETSLHLPGNFQGGYTWFDSYNGDHHYKDRLFSVPPCVNWLSKMEELKLFAEQIKQSPNLDDSSWPNQTKVAEKLGTNKTQIKRWIDDKKLTTNGKQGTECRIDPTSILTLCDREDIAYNDK